MTPEAPVPDQGWPWPLIATWVGMAINFGWNWLNFKRTGSIRLASVKFEQFKSLRSPVDGSLGLLRQDVVGLKALELSAAPTDVLRQNIADIQKTANEHFSALQVSLQALDVTSPPETGGQKAYLNAGTILSRQSTKRMLPTKRQPKSTGRRRRRRRSLRC